MSSGPAPGHTGAGADRWPWRRLVLALGGGLGLSAGLPPFGWWPLALAGAGVLARLLAGAGPGRRLVLGLVAGAGFLGPGLAWLTEFHLVGFALAVVLEVTLFALAVAVTPPGRGQALGLPAALVLVEAGRGVWPFGGVPIATLAQTQIGGPLAEAARLGGSLLVAALVGLTGVALASLAERRWRPGAALLAVVALVVGAGALAPRGRAVGRLDVAVVQLGGQRGLRAIEGSSGPGLPGLVATSASLPGQAELVLWPEDGVRVDGDVAASPRSEEVGGLARRLGVTIVSGVSESRGEVRHNLAAAWGPDGELLGRYRKQQVVPFGERIPFRNLVERVADTSAVPRDVVPGRGPGLLATPAGDLGVVISFEVFFPRRVRAALHEGAELVLVPTNASSYPTTQIPALELGAARLRAIESGRAVVQAAPTGFSAVVTPDGTVRRQSDLGEPAVLRAEIERRHGDTLSTRLGDGPVVAAAVVALAGGWILSRRRRPRPAR
ncbi:MAG: apolipoprotein N-acyltransferase [Actinomycetota bacterium]|nr:apolipoprotein N-acyltransferase [Actinomycetota bacterium]